MRFTPVPEGEPGKHMDPITKETFTNTSRLVVLAPTGWVQLRARADAMACCFEQFAGRPCTVPY